MIGAAMDGGADYWAAPQLPVAAAKARSRIMALELVIASAGAGSFLQGDRRQLKAILALIHWNKDLRGLNASRSCTNAGAAAIAAMAKAVQDALFQFAPATVCDALSDPQNIEEIAAPFSADTVGDEVRSIALLLSTHRAGRSPGMRGIEAQVDALQERLAAEMAGR